ncbi:hypothetical protein AB0G04_24340 [Actinoplanes sp. NPDC023801]|uniref:DUF6197 family protein n=1 Tax=Actinoplanes sp. NPDC023801 TaxID=3154595 RepID=UPI0033DDA686
MHRTQNPTGTAADTTTELVVTPALTLRGAADYLELRGWARARYYSGDGAFPSACALGAIGMAAHGCRTSIPTTALLETQGDFRRAAGYLTIYLNEQGIGSFHSEGDTDLTDIVGWNDSDCQTAKNVIATLRAAADEYDWEHASEDDLETYAENELDNDRIPAREGFLAWLAAHR